jgi:hypothetical protein
MALKTVEELILEQYDIKDHYDSSQMIWQYRIVDKINGEEKAQIQLSFTEATVAEYTTSNHWFTPSETTTVDAINVRWLTSHQKGLGSLMLAYGVLKMKSKNPKIKYSVLDDDSDQSTHITKNIYSRFGYSPVEAVKRTGENTVQLQGPEKQVLLTDFVMHVEAMFPRGRSKNRTASRRSSSRRAESRRSSSRKKANSS